MGPLPFIRVLHGITFGVITMVKGTISARFIPAFRRGEGIRSFSLAMGLMVEGAGYQAVYLVGAVLMVLAGALYIVQMKRRGPME